MPALTPDMLVADVIKAWPAVTPVFRRRHMACPGCAMAPFMTLTEAARSHGLDAATLLADLAAALEPRPTT